MAHMQPFTTWRFGQHQLRYEGHHLADDARMVATTRPPASQLKLKHSFLGRPAASLLACWILIALTLGMLWLNARSQNFLNCDMECGETALAIRAAVEFANYGLKFGLLENLGTPEAPMLYTHSVNLGSMTFVLLETLGVHDFSYQALLPLFAYGLGLYYVFLTVRAVTRSDLCALLTLLMFATTYWAVACIGAMHVTPEHVLNGGNSTITGRTSH